MFSLQEGVDATPASIYGLNYHARCISAVNGDQGGPSQFLIGTLSLRDENELHLIEVEGDAEDVRCLGIFSHNREIWDISPSLHQTTLLGTVSNSVGTDGVARRRASLYEMDVEDSSLKHITDFGAEYSLMDGALSLHWQRDHCQMICAVHSNGLLLFDITSPEQPMQNYSFELAKFVGKGKWDPHFQNQFCYSVDRALYAYDFRGKKVAWEVPSAHNQTVRDVDYNPNRPYVVVSCGDDCRAKFWDIRNLDQPLRDKKLHSHWLWAVKFNPFHDQLVLSASSDSNVKLWDFESISSVDQGSGKDSIVEGKLVNTYDEHEDSVYSVAWSAGDPWLFASLSYDGRVAICAVPQSEQMRILLSDSED